LAVKVLDESWNARNFPESALDGVRIDHAVRHKVSPDWARKFLALRGIERRLA